MLADLSTSEITMTDKASQDGRTAKLATPLGKDILLLDSFQASEAMGELFEIRIDAVSEQAEIDFDKALGQNCSIQLVANDGVVRDFSGVLTEARWVGPHGRFHAYSLVLRPWLWLLSLTSDCRIFPNMTPKQIIRQVFEDRGFTNVLDLAVQDYPTLEYTVQYIETDLAFVLRLMEEYGIYYYFQFEPGDGDSPSIHYLVLADSTTHVPLPKLTEVVYLPSTVGARYDSQQFDDWKKSHAMVTGVFTLNDYDYEKPGADLLASERYKYKFEHGEVEIFRYIGDYSDHGEGKKLAQVPVDSERTRNLHCDAAGSAPSITPGYVIKRTSTDEKDTENGEYLILRCTHAFGRQAYESGYSGGGEIYYGAYELAKSDIPYRMPQRTAKPKIIGTQSALVVGKQGEEIDVDEQGRICVQFYWDRKKKASRRVRVAQFWAGMQRGTLYLPRIGDEVLVQYDEGDPDRPLVVGSVYNGANKVPTPLPAKKTHSGILTRSSKGGNGYNMLLFEDLAGSEFVKLRCQKDLMFKALNNEQRDILNSQTENIGNDETINVGFPNGSGNFTLNALNKVTINVGPQGSPMTQLIMDTSSITLNVGPGGSMSQIVMNQTSITMQSTQITVTGNATVSVTAPMVQINS
jgi:type VI secretion system secreted protein VgrG